MRKRLHYWLPLFLVILFAVVQPTEAQATTVSSGTCGENITYTLDSNGTMTISGTGEMDTSSNWELWYDIKPSIKTVIIEEGITSIDDTFINCTNLVSINIPDSVTHIGPFAFYNCPNLSSITIPKNVTSIGEKAFYNCSSLDGFWVDEANPNYSSDQYGVLFNKDKTKLMKAPQTLAGDYTVPDGVMVLGSYYELFDHPYDTAFSGCTKLTGVTMPDSVTVIDEASFVNCSSLSKVNIPNSVKEIRYITFMNCTSLTSITIPDSVTEIQNYAFQSCSNLIQITFGKGIQEVGEGAFSICDNIWHVLYTETEEEAINIDFITWDDEGNELSLSPTRHYNCTGNEILDLINKKCSICLANCNHSWDNGVITQEATCKEEGVRTYTCTVCGTTKTEVISKLSSHTFDSGKVTKEATCKEEGVHTYTCTVCGTTKTEATSKLSRHTWDNGKVTKEATCKEEGVMTYTCMICTEARTETIPKLVTHTPGADATASTPQTCTVCGKELKPATGTTPPPATVPPTTAPPATVPPTTVPATTVPPTTVPPTTVTATHPTSSEATTSSVTSTQLEGNDTTNEGESSVVAVVVIVVFAGGGTAAGVILWKRKY